MSKITCLVFFAIAVSFSGVHAAISHDEKIAFRDAMKPIFEECAKENGVSHDEIRIAKAAGNPNAVNPCFIGCVFKKVEVFNSEGKLDLDRGLEQLKKFVKDDADYNKLAKIGKQCESVNDQAVSDGEAGCDRAKLLMTCALEHKAEFPF